jgi:3-phenylpropionate/trans-cinnamate dioxygenase ferredoxin reductase subunit
MRIAVIGAGQATATLLNALIRGAFAGSVTVFNAEGHRPAQRPPLSKTFFKTKTPEWLLPDALMQSPQIQWINQPATGIDPDAGRVFWDDHQDTFDHIVLATGTRSRQPQIAGASLQSCCTLRTLADAEMIASRITPQSRVVIQGSGFLAFEIAHALQDAVASLSLLLKTDRAMPQVSDALSQRLVEACPAIQYPNTHIESVSPERADMQTSAGTLACDLLISAIGSVANVELGTPWGLTDAHGIAVDASMQTAHPRVSAIGEVASFLNPHTGRTQRIESIAQANDTAQVAAARLLGTPQTFEATPWFWSDQGADKLQIAGLADRADGATVISDEGDALVVARHQQAQVTAVEALNQAREFMAARRLFEHGPVDLSALKHAGSAFALLQSSRS